MAGEIETSDSWENNFGVLGPGAADDFPGDREMWCVHDAEMQFVCRAASEENAERIARVLSAAWSANGNMPPR